MYEITFHLEYKNQSFTHMLYRTRVAVLFLGTCNTQHMMWAECTIFRGVRKIAKSNY